MQLSLIPNNGRRGSYTLVFGTHDVERMRL
jgi:hypothetical protein